MNFGNVMFSCSGATVQQQKGCSSRHRVNQSDTANEFRSICWHRWGSRRERGKRIRREAKREDCGQQNAKWDLPCRGQVATIEPISAMFVGKGLLFVLYLGFWHSDESSCCLGEWAEWSIFRFWKGRKNQLEDVQEEIKKSKSQAKHSSTVIHFFQTRTFPLKVCTHCHTDRQSTIWVISKWKVQNSGTRAMDNN